MDPTGHTMTYFAVLVSFLCVCDAALFSDVQWTRTTTLSEYVSYKSLSIWSVHILEQTVSARYIFTAEATGEGCTFRDVHVYFQHGSYPLVTPYNETYPGNFYLTRTDAYNVSLTKPASNLTIALSAPRPGTWYFAAFLPKATSDKISVKFDSSSCKYGMSIIVETRGVDNIPEVDTNDSHSLRLRKDPVNSQIMYRYRLPHDTVQYEIVIDNCQTVFLPDNQHVSDGQSSYTYSRGSSSTIDLITPLSKAENDSSSNIGSGPDSTLPNVTSSATSSVSSTNTPEPTAPTSLPTVVTSSQCPVNVTISSEKLPTPGVKDRYNCSNSTHCQQTILSPTIGKWTYLSIILDGGQNVSEVTFRLTFNIKSCGSSKFMFLRTLVDAQQIQPRSRSSQLTTIPQDLCLLVDPLGRLKNTDDAFNVSFMLVGSGPYPVPLALNDVRVLPTQVMVTSFDIQDHVDTGGTFRLQSKFNGDQHITNNQGQYVVAYVCMMKNAIPGGSTVMSCDPGVGLVLNSSLSEATSVYIPYPKAGTWFLGITGHCISTKNGSIVPCAVQPLINLDLGVAGCVDGTCGTYGTCRLFFSDDNIFSCCQCFAGWRGYGCTDGTEGRTKNEELAAVLLLTLSNLFFLPAIVLAIYLGFYKEAFVYVFNMFFSAFYHACDTSDLVYYCMFKYDVLQKSDLLGSISSFWVTILALANLRPGVRSFVDMSGVICVAFGVMWDQNGPWKFLVPSGFATLLMFLSWMLQCKHRRSLFPPKMYYLKHFLPGVLLAATGLVLFSVMETTENYKYIHSLWHVTISLSIVFLLPPNYWEATSEKFKRAGTHGTASIDIRRNLSDHSLISADESEESANTRHTGRSTHLAAEMDTVPFV